jgi:phosphohistidine phosphatase
MRRLFLVRHAKAELGFGMDDYERKLVGRGREDAATVARALAARNILPQALIHSGAARAKETAELFAAEWNGEAALEEDSRLYDAPAGRLLARARALDDGRDRIAFVAHNPGLGELAVLLAGSGAHEDMRRMRLKYPTCAVAALDFPIARWDDIQPGAALVSLYVTPADLEAGTD